MHKRSAGGAIGTALGILAICAGSGACGGKPEAVPQAPKGPALGPLELPVSLRAGDVAPTDFHEVEITPAELRVGREPLLALQGGKVPVADRSDGLVPKLEAALQRPMRSRLAVSAHAMVPYETLVLVLASASRAGIHQLSLQVRKPGAGADTGWLSPTGFQTAPATKDEVAVAGVPARDWDEFSTVWQAMYDACAGGSQSNGCGYVSSTPAVGGKLKLVLHAAGQGLNLEFFRVGLSAAQLAAEEKQRKSQLAAHKEDFIQGRIHKTDLEKELLDGPPAGEAAFQFRATEALNPPSVLGAVMRPLCGPRACAAVVSADAITPLVRVISLIGAAFPDGAAPPSLAFEQPASAK